jgi:hypothetical protein
MTVFKEHNAQDIRMTCDNQGAEALMQPVGHQIARDINVGQNFNPICKLIGEIKVKFCPTQELLTDILTKAELRSSHVVIMIRMRDRWRPVMWKTRDLCSYI